MSLQEDSVLSSSFLPLDGFYFYDGKYGRIYSVVRCGEMIGEVFLTGRLSNHGQIKKVVGNPVKTIAIFTAVHVFIKGTLPDISTDVELISEVSL